MQFRTYITICMLLSVSNPALASEYARSLAELETLKEGIQSLQQEVNSARGEEDAVTADLDRTEQELARLNAEIRTQSVARAELDEEISSLKEQASTLEVERANAISHLGKLMRSMYILGKQSGIRMMVNQQDPHAAARRLTMFRYVTAAKNQQIEDVASLYEQIKKNHETTDERIQALETTIAKRERNQQKSKSYEQQRAEHLKKIRRTLEAGESKIVVY
ncbi:MAG: murein hydrolase activator EnvC family protein, partial [bacterium]